MSIAVIINPQSNGGRTGADWPALKAMLEARLGPVQDHLTNAPTDATRLTRQAIRDGATHVIGIGGDGTIDEVVNGFFTEDGTGTLINPDACFSFIMKGTGGDFRRSFGLEDDAQDYIDRIATAPIRKMDIGKITYTTLHGGTAVHYFNNIASFGMSGKVCWSVNHATWQKRFSGKFAFNWAVYTSFLTWKNKPVHVQIDDSFDEVINLQTAAICNGRYFGAGMMPAPEADMFDGLFDILMIADTNLIDAAISAGAMRNGTAPEHPKATFLQGRKVTATPVNADDKVYFEADGETPGLLPATYELLPACLPLKI